MIPWRWVGIGVLVGCSVFATWKVDAWRYGKQLADLRSAHKDEMTTIKDAAFTQMRQALSKQHAAEKYLAELDTKATTEKADALAENEKLRADVAAGDRRLRIAGRCRTDSGDVSNAASTPGLGNAGSVELTPASERTVFDIRAGIIADQAALKVLQAYIRSLRHME